MPILTLAAKDLRLLLRDPRSAVILLLTPLLLILVLGLALGEGFGEKPDDRLRISVVNLDRGLPGKVPFPEKPWSEVVIDDLSATQDIRLEIIRDRGEAERLVAKNRRPAIIVFEEDFSDRMHRCSFLTGAEAVNPFGRDGVRLSQLGATLLTDRTQPVSASIIEQVTQVTLLRVVIPWMIGKAFARVGDEKFMELVANRLNGVKPIPPELLAELDPVVQKLLTALTNDAEFKVLVLKEFSDTKGSSFIEAGKDAAVIAKRTPEFQRAVHKSFQKRAILERLGKEIAFGEVLTPAVQKQVGPTVKRGVGDLFSSYNFEATRWSDLVKSETREGIAANRVEYKDSSGSGVLNRGALRYQILVPSYTVMFAFFLVLSVGWLFVAERKHGTLVRLRAAPLTRGQILLGKLLPCLAVSLLQGVFLLAAGRLIFGMTWGSRPELLLPLVGSTSFAAVGLAILVASVARTETQVAVYGTLLVLVLGGVSGSLMPRDLMPEQMKAVSLVTPHAWALDAYNQLLATPTPDVSAVLTACAALCTFGAAFTALAWWRMDLE
ncbi:abc-2 type transporter : ABC-2 type transporter OS=Planctomyces limnophilus (strain ATCC 43296 / DSM 3776 / IFAM 1008 / 290) GN=Plim_4114 PE=4 SV=1: ABC2_membrane_3 [Gemmata massiliana]|uniref:ABC transmembrane type-2 domain-containing protein n=1 Tax=Gemmata massiliana TaxID=1210884 RepID=A0A6P2D2D0_9BACT|nr:ABC transporter permease [Gemmata massiliana]VTR94244.1 abc-2 type transporter : ABC-2 type transporter OS=Planctomyces limnophilus (strain ATCC 43296 / DSM 3776 / IFAM 1008 / 290) GN=Plim_4114 PE=4 SV=1: ABC2_membrane_3 [Gemmata massiliana]